MRSVAQTLQGVDGSVFCEKISSGEKWVQWSADVEISSEGMPVGLRDENAPQPPFAGVEGSPCNAEGGRRQDLGEGFVNSLRVRGFQQRWAEELRSSAKRMESLKKLQYRSGNPTHSPSHNKSSEEVWTGPCPKRSL